VKTEAVPTLLTLVDEAQDLASADDVFPDERLKLLFVCAHPAIDAGVRTPLMLQTVLGLDAARIASAFLVQSSAMGQRLSRAKAKIRVARVAFEIPTINELPPRLTAVLEAIYAAYGSGWDDVAGADPRRKGLAVEAIDLGRLLTRLMPDQPEALGLLALMLHCEARRDARRTPGGGFVPLSEQDVTRWSEAMIEEAEKYLGAAARRGQLGRFQLEAAIQSAHAQRVQTGRTDWEAVALLYEALVRVAPTIGALVGCAAAVAEARGAETGWGILGAIPADAVKSYQPYWAVAAHLLKRMQRASDAQAAYSRAIGLCEDSETREFLIGQSRAP
jgi:RNA polymerase sigma-70 factor (ECF subfamily)